MSRLLLKKRRRLTGASALLAMWVLIVGLAKGSSASADDFYHKKILILHSYAIDYAWTRSVNKGINATLSKLDPSNVLRYEFLDTKNIHSQEYYHALSKILKTKYQHIRFDGIISVDNNALGFLEKYGEFLFQDTPVVATGINYANQVSPSSQTITIIAEEADHKATLSQALSLRPEARNCYVVSDSTTTGKLLQSEVKQMVESLDTAVKFHFVDTLSFETIKPFALSVDSADFIYLLPFFRDAVGKTFDQGHVAAALSRYAQAPIFVSWEFQLGTGVVGGSVVSGSKYGEMAAALLLDKLSGLEIPKMVHSSKELSANLYDWKVLHRFGLEGSVMPEDVQYINKPVPFITKHKTVIVPLVIVILILSSFVLLLLKNLQSQKLINRRNSQIIALNDEVIETQRELVTTLGEVIETRSKETGHHVKRVAKVSRLLGEKAGLPPQDLEVLEAASPLHDVGKIGIPENILHHPGQLDDKAMEVIREHTTIGRDLLQYSDRALLSSACTIAYQHHERWDGTGYPNGLSGEDINIFARITMLADVYDALSMDRCYKKAWTEEKVLRYIRQERGRFFDPKLVDIFFENFEEIRSIRLAFSTESSDCTQA